MSDDKQCPQCGAALPAETPEALCPACLLRRGFETQTAGGMAASNVPPPTPEALASRFPQLEIVELIGRGGMGVVYKARHRGLDRWVALKILPAAAERDPSFAERFAREARALAKLDHPNIVAVHDSGEAGGLYYFIMEYVDGANLRQVLAAGGMKPEQALAIVPQICEALQYAHDQGVVHRDIKPENILVDKQGRVKIADFGLAKIVGREALDFTLTGVGEVMGTPAYMAPEQVEHPSDVDHRADIYSLGVVFYQMLTGELPLGRFAPPSRKVQIDVRLDEVVLRALEKEPGLRYQQAGEVKTEVETIAGSPGAPVSTGGKRSINYRSETTLCGLPLVHIATGTTDLVTGKIQSARGILAIGNLAYGVIAIGGTAIGAVAIGGIAIGGVAVGAVGIGLWALAVIAAGLFGASGILFSIRTNTIEAALYTLALFGICLAVSWAVIRKREKRPTGPESAYNPWHLAEVILGSIALTAATLAAAMTAVAAPFPANAIIVAIIVMAVTVTLLKLTGLWPKRWALSPLSSKKWTKGLSILPIVIAVMLLFRTFVMTPYRAASDAAAPEITQGSQFFVWKLSRHFDPGDLIAYRRHGKVIVGRVVRNENGTLRINHNHAADAIVEPTEILGKVISVFWRAPNHAAGLPGKP